MIGYTSVRSNPRAGGQPTEEGVTMSHVKTQRQQGRRKRKVSFSNADAGLIKRLLPKDTTCLLCEGTKIITIGACAPDMPGAPRLVLYKLRKQCFALPNRDTLCMARI